MNYLKLIALLIFVPSILISQEYEILKHNEPIIIKELAQLNSKSRECNLSIIQNSSSISLDLWT